MEKRQTVNLENVCRNLCILEKRQLVKGEKDCRNQGMNRSPSSRQLKK